jgi:hypothetical protein
MSTRSMIGTALLGLSCLLAFGSAACSGAPDGEGTGESEAAVAKGGGGTVGGACTATDSNGHTHSGTYTNDVDGLNCAGPWGSVNCTNADGSSSGKCKDAAKTVPPRPTPAPVPTVIKLG